MRNKNIMDAITKAKRNIIKYLYTNKNIIALLNNEKVDPETPDTAEGVCIFPFVKVPGIKEDAECYIGVKIDTQKNYENPVYQYLDVVIAILCADSILYVNGEKGIRTDLIGAEISKMFNHNDEIGFEMELIETIEGSLSESKYYFRNLQFRMTAFNNVKCGVPEKYEMEED